MRRGVAVGQQLGERRGALDRLPEEDDLRAADELDRGTGGGQERRRREQEPGAGVGAGAAMVGAVRGHASDPPPLLERERELAAVAAAVDAAAAGHGSVLWIEGPAGIGKTRLLRAARAHAERSGVRVLRARASELEREFAFGVVRGLFEPAVAAEPGVLASGPARLAAPVVTLTEDTSGQAVVTAERLHGLYWLTVALADGGPLLLLVDDAHWADEPSLRALAYLARRVEELPVAIMIAIRPLRALRSPSAPPRRPDGRQRGAGGPTWVSSQATSGHAARHAARTRSSGSGVRSQGPAGQAAPTCRPRRRQQPDPGVVRPHAAGRAGEQAAGNDGEPRLETRDGPLQLGTGLPVDGRPVPAELAAVELPVAGGHGERSGREHGAEDGATTGASPPARRRCGRVGAGPEPAVDVRAEDPRRPELGLQRHGQRVRRGVDGVGVALPVGRPELRRVGGGDLGEERGGVGRPAGEAVWWRPSWSSSSVVGCGLGRNRTARAVPSIGESTAGTQEPPSDGTARGDEPG